jgi:hypothetical protein
MKVIEYYGLIGTVGDGKAAVYWFRDKEIVDKLISQSMFVMTDKITTMRCPDYRDIEAELGIEFADSAWEVFMDIPPAEEEEEINSGVDEGYTPPTSAGITRGITKVKPYIDLISSPTFGWWSDREIDGLLSTIKGKS